LIALGGLVLYAGLLAIVAAVILLLAEHMTPWIAALVVGVVVIAIGYGLLKQQLNALQQLDPKPRATIETLRQDKEWAKEQLQ
jgi:xanthine/uracil permease